MEKKRPLQIRNSTAEFLVFTSQSGEDTIEVRIQDNTVWLTQKLIASLFDIDRSVITKHLANIYQEGELIKDATCAIFAQVQIEGTRQVTRDIELRTGIVGAYCQCLSGFGWRPCKKTYSNDNGRLGDTPDRFLEADDRDILQNSGKITAQMAKISAESEFEKYRIIQDRLFESDFDKEIKRIVGKRNKTDD